jgi:hypothetical protein
MSDQDPSPASHPAADLQTERRAYVRLASDLTASCDAADRVHEAGWAGRVRDISQGGVGLVLQHRFRPGTSLAVELRKSSGELLRTIEALVVHATAILVDGNPCWLLGCAFHDPLSDEEFAALQ